MRLRLAAPARADAGDVQQDRQEQPQPVQALKVPTPCMRKTYISVVNGRNMKPRHGMMNVLKARVHHHRSGDPGKQQHDAREDETKAVKHPELLLDLILITFPFQDRDWR